MSIGIHQVFRSQNECSTLPNVRSYSVGSCRFFYEYVELYRYITTTFVNFLYESFFKQTSFVLYQDQSNYYIISHTILSSKHLFGILPQSVSVYTTT